MWDRSVLKERAKNVLSRTYWFGFVVCLISGFLTNRGTSILDFYNDIGKRYDIFSYRVALLLFLCCILFSIFIGNPVSVGSNAYFMKSRVYEPRIADLFSSFTKNNYLNICKTMFFMNLYIVLWSFLLIIPGIIKSYQYYFVSYIMSENPNISCDRALELSTEMTNGIKWKIFVLQLSFLGWTLLGLLCCVIGVIFVTPYVEATFAELYAFQREKALTEGYTNTTELCGY